MFCRHRWTEQKRQGVPGAIETGRSFKFGGGLWSQEAADAFYGYTLVELKCSLCGDLRSRKLVGCSVSVAGTVTET